MRGGRMKTNRIALVWLCLALWAGMARAEPSQQPPTSSIWDWSNPYAVYGSQENAVPQGAGSDIFVFGSKEENLKFFFRTSRTRGLRGGGSHFPLPIISSRALPMRHPCPS